MHRLPNIAQVYCKGCKVMHNVPEVSIINIEEDDFGYDQLTFTCPVNKQVYTGTVYGR